MVTVGTGGLKTRFIKKEWPIEEGLIAGTTKQAGRTMNLIPRGIAGVKTTLNPNDQAGL